MWSAVGLMSRDTTSAACSFVLKTQRLSPLNLRQQRLSDQISLITFHNIFKIHIQIEWDPFLGACIMESILQRAHQPHRNLQLLHLSVWLQSQEPESTMQVFESWFDGVNFKRGMEIGFASHFKGQLVAQIDGKQVSQWWPEGSPAAAIQLPLKHLALNNCLIWFCAVWWAATLHIPPQNHNLQFVICCCHLNMLISASPQVKTHDAACMCAGWQHQLPSPCEGSV